MDTAGIGGSNAAADRDGGRDPVLRLPLMEAELAARATEAGDHPSVAELRTAIDDAKTAAELGVRKSQLLFYSAFSDGDPEAMARVWSEVSHVRCVHPGMASIEGREAVLNSWRQIFGATTRNDDGEQVFTIEPERVRIEICGTTAICSCVEKTPNDGRLEATNVYKRENGSWKMTLHQAGPVVVASSIGL